MRVAGKYLAAMGIPFLAMMFSCVFASGDQTAATRALRVEGTQLVDAHGTPVQLRGMSSHGLHWFPRFTSKESILDTKKRGANLFRLAMYADGEAGGYCESPQAAENNMTLLLEGIENALAADMYAIVDWHLLKCANPLTLVNEALLFFEKIARKYPDHPAILYEICNEPSGATTWEHISTYAEIIIPVIRSVSPNAIILVGTPNWSSDVLAVLENPLDHDNVMYTYHLYTGDTDYDFQYKLDKMRAMGLPVFVSEWGISRDGEEGELDMEEARAFIAYMRRHLLSWANWSLSNKDEDFSAIRPEVARISGWEDEDLTESGRLVFEALENTVTGSDEH